MPSPKPLAAAVAIIMASVVAARAQVREPEPGEGVICAWAIYSAMIEVASRCFPGEHADVQVALRDGVSRIDDYVRRNGEPPPSEEDIARFKREQGLVGAPTEQLCHGDAVGMYHAIAAQGAEKIRESIDAVVARPGRPSWGTCL